MDRPPGLGPHLVGQRVVVRRVLRGETGPSGGPAMTDLLGIMESWGDGATTVRDERGQVTAIALADIVSGKPVPPRPSVRHRVSPAAAERRAVAGWPAVESRPLGEWLLRASGGYSARANSVLAAGDPGVPFDEALARTRDFYARHSLPACAQLVVDEPELSSFAAAGWVPARPGEADTLFQLASVSRTMREIRRSGRSSAVVELGTSADAGWLADEPAAREHGDVATAVLEGPDEVGFAAVRDPSSPAGAVVAKGRAAYADDWVGITNVAVSPDHRRRGLARVVLAALLEWGAERGATTAYLQVRGDNAAAVGLYESVGFVTHHAYRYLTTP